MQIKIRDLSKPGESFAPNQYLTPDKVGPWFVGTGKVAESARATAISRIVSARLNGWQDPDPYVNAGMARSTNLRTEALGSVQAFLGPKMDSDWLFQVDEFIAAKPYGYCPSEQIGVSIRVPGGAHHVQMRATGMETDMLWEALASLAFTGAERWLVMSYSPPLLPVFWMVARSEAAAHIAAIEARLPAFNTALADTINREQEISLTEMVWGRDNHFQLSNTAE